MRKRDVVVFGGEQGRRRERGVWRSARIRTNQNLIFDSKSNIFCCDRRKKKVDSAQVRDTNDAFPSKRYHCWTRQTRAMGGRIDASARSSLAVSRWFKKKVNSENHKKATHRRTQGDATQQSNLNCTGLASIYIRDAGVFWRLRTMMARVKVRLMPPTDAKKISRRLRCATRTMREHIGHGQPESFGTGRETHGKKDVFWLLP